MVRRKQALEELEKTFLFNYLDPEGKKAIKLTSNHGSLMGNVGTRGFPRGFAEEYRRGGKVR
ncbi:MAG TPA: hypothetical protein ENI13_00025 [candidate division CPR3 bacterium]|uniref:Uncharacterized protein n=1 Tax=candidate division CPR3 bacterium TaxID=2268181 RepID=A0A7C1NPN1_UNCC3|nr:hypothetical protein [candidate division CPR3 bacterium]